MIIREKNRWHFSHLSNKECNGDFETCVHLYAKELIKKNNKILLPHLRLSEYLEFNKMDSAFTHDMHKWENANQERITNQVFIKENIYSYVWKENEVRVNDFILDCIVEIDGKRLAIEMYVTHSVGKEKGKKVKKSNIDMIEIDLSHLVEEMQEGGFDLDQYILLGSKRHWIYKTKIVSEEKKLYQKIYNTKQYTLNEKYTKKELVEKRISENRKKEQERKNKIIQEHKNEERRKYAIEHKDEYRTNKFNKFLNVIESYSKNYTSNIIHVCNIPVRGEYVFNCSREIWEKAIYDTFILNREGKIIQLAKIFSWVEKYSRLKYFKEFDYSKDEIWDSKYDAVRNYLIELENLKIISSLDYNITKFGKIKIVDSNKNNANLKIVKEYKEKLVCKNCGEIFETIDTINKFYIINFEMDKDCFQKMINNYNIRQPFKTA